MRSLVFAVIASCCCFLFVSAQKYHPGYRDGAIWLKLKPTEEILTKKKEKPTVDDIRILKPLKDKYKLKDLKKPFQKIRKSSPLQNTYILTFDQIHEADKLIKELEKSGVLEYAEKVPLLKTAVAPSDPSLGSQWHLSKINAEGAWNKHTSASNTIIAIVDDAVQIDHPDLAPNIWVNSSELNGITGADDDGNGYVDDIKGWDFVDNDGFPDPPAVAPSNFGHGTHVAGIASAATNNSLGISSIGYNAKLMCIKTAAEPTEMTYGLEGVIYAADNGAHVINLSWGTPGNYITLEYVIKYALDKGCIIVAAAGNSNIEGILYPAAYDGVISVAATDIDDKKATFSNYHSKITISAPGFNIYSTMVESKYGDMSGTSMASPLVAGLVALMRSYNPAISRTELINYLKSTADNINSSNASYIGKLGAGRINAANAIQAIGTTFTLAPIADFSIESTTVSAGANVSFRDFSSYATSWSWSFPGGTPSSSSERNPVVVYNTPGKYDVFLTVNNDNGSDIEERAGYITVRNCVQINDPVPRNWDEVAYIITGGGWVSGVNKYWDRQKAMFFDASTTSFATHITRLKIKFGGAYSADQNKNVIINIYDGTSGVPGTLIGSTNLSMGQIMYDVNNNNYTTIDFINPVPLPGSKRYFVSVDFSNLYGNLTTDPLFIWSNESGQTTPTNVWEQWWNDGSWHRFDEGMWGEMNVSLFIHPYLTNQPAVATIKTSSSSICAGGTVTFDALGSTYEKGLYWEFPTASQTFVPGNPNPSVSFNTPGIHQATLTVWGGGCEDIRSAVITINVNENLTPSITLASKSDASHGTIIFTATAMHGGTNPGFIFKKNGEVVQSGPSNTWTTASLNETDVINCTLTSSETCVTSSTAISNNITIDPFTIAALPVELLYFKGNNINGESLLQWATVLEINTDKFIVERSTDGMLFQQIGTVKAKGESNATLIYQFTEAALSSAYYRLYIIDLDGSARYSQVIYLSGEQKTKLKLWPNPAHSGQTISILSTGNQSKQVIIQVTDALGQVKYRKSVIVKNGNINSEIPSQDMNGGVYFITVSGEKGELVQYEKLVIVK